MNKQYMITILLLIILISSVFGQNQYIVYQDGFVNGLPSGSMGAADGKSILIDNSYKQNTYKGESCLKLMASGAEAWAGLFIQQGGNWLGSLDPLMPLANLTGKKYLVFSARSDQNFTVAKLGMGEGKEPNKAEEKINLTSQWQRFVMEMPNQDLSRVNGLFMVVFEKSGTIYLDEIYYTNESFVPQNTDIVYKERKEALDPTSFYIYSDKFDNGIASGYMGEKNGASLKIDENCKTNPYLGVKCIKMAIDKSEAWRGIYILYSGSWNAAVNEDTRLADLSAYDKLEFYARADVKNDEPFIISEIGVGAGDKLEEKRSETYVEVGSSWKKYTISLKGMELKKINSLLFITLPEGTLYLDEIRFLKKKEK